MKAFNFTGSGFEYFKIWIVNILLTIVTLGLYYPWAKVRNNRYMYANATLEGRNFEYHATGKQLFLGYLIAMGLLIFYGIISNVSPIGSVIVILLLFAAVPWIIWRSLKFNMRITSFSNVRFGFDGKLGGAYFNYMLLPILFFISIYAGPIIAAIVGPQVFTSMGLFGSALAFIGAIGAIILAVYMYALLKKRNASYVINSTRYGQGQFSTDLKTSVFLKIILKTIGLFILGIVIYMILVGIVSAITGAASNLLAISPAALEDPEAISEIMANSSVIVLVALVYLGFIVVSILVFSYSFSRQRAYIFANSNLDKKIELASTLKARPLAWISITNFLAIIFSLGLAIPWATVRLTRFVLDNTQVDTSIGFENYVSQKQAEQSSLGEQIGDAFDVDVGLGF